MEEISVGHIYFNLAGLTNDFTDQVDVAELRLTVDRRDVNHDGYCSDPGEDTGEWKHDIHERYHVNKAGLEKLKPYINSDHTVQLSILQKLFDSDQLGCQCGSNYCGYNGERKVKDGWMVYKPELDEEQLNLKAKWNMQKNGGTMEANVAIIIKRNERKQQLNAAMKEKGLSYNNDKKCQKWIERGYPLLENVIKDMITMKWCFEYQNMRTLLRNYIKDNRAVYSPEIFNKIKDQILKEHPVPADLPWLVKP